MGQKGMLCDKPQHPVLLEWMKCWKDGGSRWFLFLIDWFGRRNLGGMLLGWGETMKEQGSDWDWGAQREFSKESINNYVIFFKSLCFSCWGRHTASRAFSGVLLTYSKQWARLHSSMPGCADLFCAQKWSTVFGYRQRNKLIDLAEVAAFFTSISWNRAVFLQEINFAVYSDSFVQCNLIQSLKIIWK